MIPVAEKSFLVEPSGDGESVITGIAQQFQIEETGTTAGKKTLYDTFDWRLYRKNMVLSISKNSLVLRDFEGRELHRTTGRKKKKIFWWDLEPSALTSVLRDRLSMRALSPILDFSYQSRFFKVMNRDRKTVVRLILTSHVAINDGVEMELPEQVHIQGLRGYEKPFAKVVGALPEEVLQPLGRYIDYVDAAYGITDRQPLDYGARFGVALDKTVSIGQAVSKICLNLAGTMATNLPGLLADTDTEFLHDFRIAIRRTRSLLSLLGKAMPTDQIARFETEFKWLGSVTGPLRDIDVYLLKRDDYLNLLPESLSEGLELFFNELQQKRGEERNLLNRYLSSPRYQELIVTWNHFLSDPESELFSGVRQQECKPLVDSIIRKRFGSLIKSGDRISDDSPDQKLHSLRIKGKKFRYLLEFFRAFYDSSEVDLFLRHMKKLQDNLGDFNDLSVQIEMLELKLNTLKGRNRQTLQLAASLGSLITRLAEEHKKTRKKFGRTYKTFSTSENSELIARMTGENSPDFSAKRKI